MEKFISRRQVLKVLSSAGMAAPFLSSWDMEKWLSVSGTMDKEDDQTEKILNRTIPSTGEQLPVIGLGTWQQFDVGTSPSERDPLLQILEMMIEKGSKVIDSSPMYGRSEAVVGDLTGKTDDPDHFFYATKVWTRGRQSGIDQMNASFSGMNREKMDLMQIHNLVDWKTHLKTLLDWKSQGKVRYIGITHYTDSSHDSLEEIVRNQPIDFVQFNYSIRERNAEKNLLDACGEAGVAVIINSPYEGGSLFGLVKNKPLPEWAQDYNIESWGQYFLKFILAHPAVTCVIPGTSRPHHALDNMGAGFGPIPDQKAKEKMVEYINSL